MSFRKKGRKFGRERNQRLALLNGLAANLFLRGGIITTLAKAKSLRPIAEKMITKCKNSSVVSRRYARINLPKNAAEKLVEIAPKYAERKGGYIRIIKLGRRNSSDGAEMAKIELI